MSDDDPFYSPHLKPAPARIARPGELLFELVVEELQFRFELRDHGEQYGVECQIFRSGEFWASRRFDPWLDTSRPTRELAMQWAEELRRVVEANPNDEIVRARS